MARKNRRAAKISLGYWRVSRMELARWQHDVETPNKKRRPENEPPSSVTRCQAPAARGLREIVAEGREQHIVHGLGRDLRHAGRKLSAVARPGILGEVRILHAKLEAALRSLVKPVPEAQSAFLDDADIASAIGATGRRVELICRYALGGATGVYGAYVAITADLVELESGGGSGRDRSGRGDATRGGVVGDRRGLENGDGVVAGDRATRVSVARAPSVLSAIVGIDVELGSGVPFEPGEAMEGANQGQGAVRTSGDVRELRRAIAPDAVAADNLKADVYLLVEQRPETADASTASSAAIVEGSKAANHSGSRGGAKETAVLRKGRRSGNRIAGIGAYDAARINSVAERADYAKHLIVAKTRVRGCLKQKIRCLVHGVAVRVKGVEETAALSRSVEEEVAGDG